MSSSCPANALWKLIKVTDAEPKLELNYCGGNQMREASQGVDTLKEFYDGILRNYWESGRGEKASCKHKAELLWIRLRKTKPSLGDQGGWLLYL